MVNLTRIYTRTGDAGTTRLADNSEVAKTDLRVEAYGDVDEANSTLGVALATGELPADLAGVLRRVQNELFDVGADLSTPVFGVADSGLRVTQTYIDRLEALCDRFNADLEPLRSFVLPGGSLAASHLHVARTIIRRAERAGWGAAAAHPGEVNPLALTYLNRLSDLLFILARSVNGPEAEVLWIPGDRREES